MKRITSLFLTLALCLALTLPAYAQRFGDVPTTHWAYNDIEALATGGLVNGVGDGNFSPDTKFTVSQMAQIIANAQGYDTAAHKGEYWYTAAVQHCLDIGCLPNNGAITPANYDVECSRELAVYMLVNGLGIPAGKERNGAITAAYIPDYGQVEMDYRQAVLDAYQYGLLNGVDSNHTFKPKNSLARSEACAILNRAGYTTAAKKATASEGITSIEAFEAIKATGLFTETNENGLRVLTAIDRKYAGLTVSCNVSSATPSIRIRCYEYVPKLAMDKDGNVLNEDGSIFTDANTWEFYDKNGKYVAPSGYAYSSRQLLKQILNIIYPTQGNEAYETFMTVLTPPHAYSQLGAGPSAIKWYDGRDFELTLGGTTGGGYTISAGPLGLTAPYEEMMSRPMPKVTRPAEFKFAGGTSDTFVDYVTAYELNKH